MSFIHLKSTDDNIFDLVCWHCSLIGWWQHAIWPSLLTMFNDWLTHLGLSRCLFRLVDCLNDDAVSCLLDQLMIYYVWTSWFGLSYSGVSGGYGYVWTSWLGLLYSGVSGGYGYVWTSWFGLLYSGVSGGYGGLFTMTQCLIYTRFTLKFKPWWYCCMSFWGYGVDLPRPLWRHRLLFCFCFSKLLHMFSIQLRVYLCLSFCL